MDGIVDKVWAKKGLVNFFNKLEKEVSKLMGAELTVKYVFEGRSQAQTALILYSAIEVLIKQTVRAILSESTSTNSRASDKIFKVIFEAIDRDSSGHNSKYLQAINELFKEATGKPAIDEPLFRRFKKLERVRNKVAHAACKNLDLSISEMGFDFQLDLFQAYFETLSLGRDCLEFIKLHHNDLTTYFDDIAAQDAAIESAMDAYMD